MMDYCAPRAIPYAKFLEWDPLSRDAALAWQARKSATCGSCGQVKGDWTDEDGHELHPPPLIVTEHWCPGCAALETRRTNSKDLPPGVQLGFAVNAPATADE
jgi:hypothetical protein